MNLIKKSINFIYIGLIFLFSLDVLLGANGRYYEFNIRGFEVSPRMILFIAFFVIFCIKFLFKKRSYKAIFFSNIVPLLFVVLFCLAAISFLFGGVTNGFSNSFSDFKTFVFILAVFPFYDLWIERAISPNKIYNFFKGCCIALTFMTLIAQIVMIKWGLERGYNYDRIAHDLNIYFTNNYPNFAIGFRRPYGIYYDGLFFVSVCFSMIFWELLFIKTTKKKMAVNIILFVLMGYVVLQSQTRGFLIVMAITCIAAIIAKIILSFKVKLNNGMSLKELKSDIIWVVVISSLFLLSFVLIFYYLFQNTRLFDFNDNSTNVRLVFLRECFEVIFKPSVIIGKGLGFQLESKGIVHLEISLLEVLLKQGLLGLIAWSSPIFLFVFFVKRKKLASKFFIFATMLISFVYGVSFFNPHLFDIAGVLMLFFCLVVVSDTTEFLVSPSSENKKIANICYSTENCCSNSSHVYFLNSSLFNHDIRKLCLLLNDSQYTHVIFSSDSINQSLLNKYNEILVSNKFTYSIQCHDCIIYIYSIKHILTIYDTFKLCKTIGVIDNFIHLIPKSYIKEYQFKTDDFLSVKQAFLPGQLIFTYFYQKYSLFDSVWRLLIKKNKGISQGYSIKNCGFSNKDKKTLFKLLNIESNRLPEKLPNDSDFFEINI